MIVGEKKIRHKFNLPESLSQRLKALTYEPGSSMTQIVVDALVAFLDRGAQPEIGERYAIRLDRISRQLARTERRAAFVSEALGLFIQHQLTGAAHEPPFDAATAHLGRRRYEALLQLVWKRMSKGGGEGFAANSVEAKDVPEQPEAID